MKKLKFLLLISIAGNTVMTANTVDSLQNLLPSATPERKTELYLEIAKFYQANSFDSALYYYSRSQELATKLNNQSKISDIQRLKGTVYFWKGDYRQSQIEFESALNGYEKAHDEIGQAKIYNNLSMLFQAQGKNNEAVTNLEKALKTFIDNGNEPLQTLPLINLGIIYFRSGNYTKASDNFNHALIIAKKHNDLTSISNITNNLGTVYKEMGKYPEALDCFNQSVGSYQQLNDKIGESASLTNIGILFKELGNYNQAVTYIAKSLQIKREIQAQDKIPASLIILGDIYCEWKKFELAIDYYYEALDLSKKSENIADQATALYGLAQVYQKTDVYPKALDLLTEAAQMFESVDSKKELAQTLNNMGVVYSTKLNDVKNADQFFKRAETYYLEMDLKVGLAELEHNKGIHYYNQGLWDKAIASFEQSNKLKPYSTYHLFSNYNFLAECNIKINNLPAAIFSYQKALQYKDSILNDRTALQLAQFEIEQNVLKNEQEIARLKQLNEINILYLNKKKDMQYILLSFSIILVILIIVMMIFIAKQRKINIRLQLQQSKIESQKQDLQDTNMKLIDARVQAEKLSDFKSQFLANISHEIRTPLNAIIGYAKLLGKNMNAENNNQYLNNIIQASDNLSVIINDLLDFSKIEAGKMILDNTEFHPFEIITQAISTLKFRAEEKNITLEIHIDPMIPRILKGDPYRLSQIMINLLGNAIKFSHSNQVVTIEANAHIAGNKCLLVFMVKDHGIGIEAEKLESIFESFNQAQSDTARIFGGTGLGLAIVKRLVALQKGNIEVKSKLNEGSTFTISISYEIPPMSAQISPTQEKTVIYPQLHTEGKEYNILLVEDNLINQELAKDTINSWNEPFVVDIAENGREAIEALKNKHYHVIIMDIQMPIMDGHEATRFIRNEMPDPISKIPIIGMTAHAMSSEKELALKNGMNEYIIKPFNPDELKQKIVFFVNI
ncbi:MAG: hypothetical protein A2W95_06680 [Bacteroidetes bacterium GWA2_40_14]|nr:MAG: hypothetical protein A2W95_06680 [Bacteroidetes bacterium GWA2_40_14]HAZ00977.1 hypothetical protein [Marinilabiliales bacterium]